MNETVHCSICVCFPVIVTSEDHVLLSKYTALLSGLVRLKSVLITNVTDKPDLNQETHGFRISDTVNQNTSVHVLITVSLV
jgi:hypothetical protein